MVVAAVWLDAPTARALRKAGIRDSKAFGAGERARAIRSELAQLVEQRAAFVAWEAVTPREIDRRVVRRELDVLEREVAQRLIEKGPSARRIFADGRLFAPLSQRIRQLRAQSRADQHITAVAAASIVAKHRRDCLYLQTASSYGELAPLATKGMGYANAATRAFLRSFVEIHGCLPPEARLSWRWSALREMLGEDPRTHMENDQLALF